MFRRLVTSKKLLVIVPVLLVLVLSFSLATAVPVAAQATINVPADYPTIQEAIDAANPGDTIRVAAGIYEENIVIPSTMAGAGLQLLGAGKTSSIISITRGVALKVGDKKPPLMPGITIRGFGFNGNNTATHAIKIKASGASGAPGIIADNRFENFKSAIEISDSGHDYWDIKNNEFYRNGDTITAVGSYYEISGNVFENYTEGVSLEGHHFTIEDNQFLGGIDVPGFKEADLANQVAILFSSSSYDVSVTGNEITDTATGVLVRQEADLSNVAVEFNNIVGNTNGVVVEGTQVLDAKHNWWGEIGGPSAGATGVTALGTGDKISTNVTYNPWLSVPYEMVVDEGIRYYGSDSLKLQKGWNTLSIPLKLHDYANTIAEIEDIGDFLTADNYSGLIYEYDPVEGWVIPTTLVPVRGYYIKMLKDSSFPVLYSNSLGLPSFELTAGWNLIGSAFGIDKDDGASSVSFGDYGVCSSFDPPGTGTYGDAEDDATDPDAESWKAVNVALASLGANASVVISPSLPGQEVVWATVASATDRFMIVGEAYWVFMTAPATLAGFEITPFYFTYTAPAP